MNREPTPGINSEHTLGTWARIYLHGVLAAAVIIALAYVVAQLAPMFDFIGNRPLAIAIVIFILLAGPPLLGSLVLYAVFPLIGKKVELGGITEWDDRLIEEVSSAKEKAQVVLINWPDSQTRTMGVLSSTFTTEENGPTLAAVYVPMAPRGRFGYLHVVKMDEVESVDWTLKQWQLYQFTFGSATPDRFPRTGNE